MKFCPKCGEKITVSGARFCPECGGELPQSPSGAGAGPSKKQSFGGTHGKSYQRNRPASGPASPPPPPKKSNRGAVIFFAVCLTWCFFSGLSSISMLAAGVVLFIAVLAVLIGVGIKKSQDEGSGDPIMSAKWAFGAAVVIGSAGLLGVYLNVQEILDERQRAEQARVAEVERQTEITTVSTSLDQAIAEGRWEEAESKIKHLEHLGAEVEGLGERKVQVEQEVAKIRAVKAEEERKATIAAGIEQGKEISGDSEKCETPKLIAEAWEKVKLVRKDDPEWRDASYVVTRLERCRVRSERAFSKGLLEVMITQRTQMAETMELGMLDQGFDIDVAARGTNKTELRMTWVLMSRVIVHQITQNGSMAQGAFLRNLQDIGFKKVVFSDGYDTRWSYDLDPPEEGNKGSDILAGLGLGEPLKLQ